MEKKLKLVFFGTPEFAKESLAYLVENGYNVVGVVTTADKPAGRGRKLQMSPVKEYSIQKGLFVLQPTNLKDKEFENQLKSLNADMNIVVAFRMLPESIWNMPVLGTINLHGSLLPDYRGAAPINHAIINGEKITGVTTFRLKHEIDTGDIIIKKEIPIIDNETAGELHDKMMVIGAKVLAETVDIIESGSVNFIPQQISCEEDKVIKKAPKIFKEDCRINFDSYGSQVVNFIRGLSPHPGAYFDLFSPSGEVFQMKIFEACFLASEESNQPSEIASDGVNYLSINVKNGKLYIKDLQLSGKKRLKTEEFLRGFSISGDWKVKK